MALVFISHSAKEPGAEKALKELGSALTSDGFTVLLDREPGRLQPGIEWRREIYTWMALCHAAIVVFSPHALESSWVLQEATIMSWRRSLDETFVFIPMLIPPVTRQDLDTPAFRPLAIDEVEFARGPDALAEVRNRLAALKDVDPETPLQRWVERVTFALTEIEKRDSRVLDQVAHAAGLDLEWDPHLSKSLRLARQLLNADRDAIERAVVELAGVVPERTGWLDEMIEVLMPVWVDPLAVAAIPEIANRPAGPRVVAVNATDNWVGEMYVKRAGCGRPVWRIFQSNNSGGENREVEQITRDLFKDGVRKLRLPTTTPIEQFLKLTEKWALGRDRYFAVIPYGSTLAAQHVARLQDTFKAFTFVLLTGANPSSKAMASKDTVVLQPMLEPGQEDEARTWSMYLRTFTSAPAAE